MQVNWGEEDDDGYHSVNRFVGISADIFSIWVTFRWFMQFRISFEMMSFTAQKLSCLRLNWQIIQIWCKLRFDNTIHNIYIAEKDAAQDKTWERVPRHLKSL